MLADPHDPGSGRSLNAMRALAYAESALEPFALA
jgi:hypothetical protein